MQIKALLLTLIVSLYSQTSVGQAEVWYTSNVATPDMLDMFTYPDRWDQARSRIHVMKFYHQQFFNSKAECPTCGENIFPNFLARDAFDKLKNWNIKLAVEAGTVKPQSCDAVASAEGMEDLIRKLSQKDITLDAIAIDEPFISGREWCDKQDIQLTARYTANYMERVQKYYGRLNPGKGLRIGLIEAYPTFDMATIRNQAQAIFNHGGNLAFLHIDVDRIYMKNIKISDAKFQRDLNMIHQFTQSKNIPLGIIYWGQDDKDHVKYAKTVTDFAMQVKRLFGNPEHIGFQSWAHDPAKMEFLIPNNLAENNPNSHTGLLLRVFKILQQL